MVGADVPPMLVPADTENRRFFLFVRAGVELLFRFTVFLGFLFLLLLGRCGGCRLSVVGEMRRNWGWGTRARRVCRGRCGKHIGTTFFVISVRAVIAGRHSEEW